MATNLAPSEILVQTLDSFKAQVPMLATTSTNFSDQRMRLNQTVRGHIRSVPTVGAYGAEGYFTNANDAQSLLTDVDVTIDQHKHVTLNLTHLKAIADDKKNTDIADSAYAFGKDIIDNALAKVLTANITSEDIVTIANTNFDTLNTARKTLITQGANSRALYGLVNSDFAAECIADTRIASKDFFGADNTYDALTVMRGVAGFQEIREYADFPANGENLSAFFYDPRAIVIATGLPTDSTDIAASMGIPSIAATEVVTDPETGFSLLGIMHFKPGTLDLYMTITAMYGTKVGGAELEDGGYRVVTAA